MLQIDSTGGETGVSQVLTLPPNTRLMVQAWVFVVKGHVLLQSHGGPMGPHSWSAKTGQWEELRACTDGTVPTNTLIIWNNDPKGGRFFVDRVEARLIPPP